MSDRENRTYKCIILCRYILFIGVGRPNNLIFYYSIYMPCMSEHGQLHNYYYGDGVSGIIFVFFAWERVNLNAQTFFKSPWYWSFECNFYMLCMFRPSENTRHKICRYNIIYIVYLQLILVECFKSISL